MGPLLIAIGAAGCRPPQNEYVPPPPPEVTVANPLRQNVPQTMEFTGRVRGSEAVEIRARVKGFLQEKHVEGGRRVQAGDLLFTIDPRTFEAVVGQARAQVASAEANLDIANLTLQRLELAAQSAAASAQEVDRARADRDAAQAALDLARAQLQSAELDLEFTQIRAPVSGRIGLVPVDEGQLVGASDPTLLTTIINDSIVFAYYDIDEPTVLQLLRRHEGRRPGENGRPGLEVRLGQANDVGYPFVGEFDKADNTVDPETGTIRVEARFENPDGRILPGAYVRIQAYYGEREALLVPDVAVQADQGGKFVLTVGPDGTVERRTVRTSVSHERMRIIEDGLTGTERVIVNGLQRARPGAKVAPVTAPPPSGATAAGTPAGAPAPGAPAAAAPPLPAASTPAEGGRE